MAEPNSEPVGTGTVPRLFVAADLCAGAEVPATEPQVHYLLTVLRRAAGAPVVVFNGRDGAWSAQLAPAGRKAANLVLIAQIAPQDPMPPVTLAFAPLKSQRLDMLIEKATELDVGRLQPILTRRTIAARVNLARLKAITLEAAEQCERTTVPEVLPPIALEHLADPRRETPERMLLLDEGAARAGKAPHIANALAGLHPPVTLVVGPEGGFTTEERDLLNAIPSLTAVSLGPRILRAETAALAALAAVMSSRLAPHPVDMRDSPSRRDIRD